MNFTDFVSESNLIEGILRPPTNDEISATQLFVRSAEPPTLLTLSSLCAVYTNEKGQLRNHFGMNVRVGTHLPPKGGPQIERELIALLDNIGTSDPFQFHVAYETLHPFMDGNGRTGRALWAWRMYHFQPEMLELGFLHAFYYQSLSGTREAKAEAFR